MTIEHLDWHSVLSQAQKLSKLGSMQVSGSASRIQDPHISAPRETRLTSRAISAKCLYH